MNRNELEPIPYATSPNLQFPGGDIEPSQQVFLLFSELQSGDIPQQKSELKALTYNQMTLWKCQQGQEAVYYDLRLLLEGWADSTDDPQIGLSAGVIGTFSTLAFIRKTHVLPTSFASFSEEMKTMSQYSAEEIDFFANESWGLMSKTHPHIFHALYPFVTHLGDIYGFSSADVETRKLLAAASVMPYLMASTTRMLGYLKAGLKEVDWEKLKGETPPTE